MNRVKMMALEKAIDSGYGNTVGIAVWNNGEIWYERYFHGYTADRPTHVFSVTKSVFSALVGIAIGRGYIKGVDQRVLDFFPEYTPHPGEWVAQCVTIAELLTMTAPLRYEVEPYEDFFRSGNWLLAALDLLGGERHTGEFMYSPIISAHILSGILTRATGQSVFDFATKNLFAPLDIRVERSIILRSEAEQMAFYGDTGISGWVADAQGINPASWGLTLTPTDMAKIGQLYLNGGNWEGRQVVPPEWIAESTRAHSHWAAQGLSYGYLWWILDGEARVYAAMGDGGNVIYVNERKRLVVAIASLFMPEAKDRLGLIVEHIEPLFAE